MLQTVSPDHNLSFSVHKCSILRDTVFLSNDANYTYICSGEHLGLYLSLAFVSAPVHYRVYVCKER